MSLTPGTLLGPYEITSLLGAGAMGTVYRARDSRLGRGVAVKVLAAGAFADGASVQRFEHEAKAVSALNHPNVLAVFDVGNHDELHYVVSELLEGETLRKRLSGPPLAERKVLDYAIQIAHGLAAAHEKRIVHRDLKPENLFVTRDGRVKILDFGLAKRAPALPDGCESTASLSGEIHLTQPGMVLGTISYMAPEQVQGQPADTRSDIFSFGAVLYEMLAGRRAFRGETPAETMAAIVNQDPEELSRLRADVTPALERIVARCLEKRPEERFQSARDVAFAFEALSAGSAAGRRLGGLSRNGRWTAGALLAAGLGGAFLAGHVTAPPRIPEFRQLSSQRGAIRSARFRPDGESVVYSASREAGYSRVFSWEPGAPRPRLLGLPPGIVLGVSRVGEMAVLLDRVADASATLARIAAGRDSWQAVSQQVVDASWAPDGRVCVLRTLRDGQQLEFPPGEVLYRPTKPVQSPRVSPKGDRVAFSDGERIQVIDTDGKNLVTLSSRHSPVQGLAWSPRGDEVWFTGGEAESRGLHAVSLSGRHRLVYRLPGDTTLQDISADGRVLMTHGIEREGIVVYTPGADREHELVGYVRPRVVALSPDGRTLLVQEEAEQGGHRPAVYLQPADGSAPMLLGEGHGLDLSPDGSRALVVIPGSPSRLVLVSTEEGTQVTIPVDRLEPVAGRWLPDGKRLVVLAREPGSGLRPFLLDFVSQPVALAPETFEPLETSAEQGALIAVSPDGSLVALVSSGGRVVLVPLDGGVLREVPGLGAAAPIRWSDDGRSLYVRASQGGREMVFRADPATGEKEFSRELLPSDPEGVTAVDTVDVTPDGRAYAYSYHRQLVDLYVVEGLK